MLLSPFPIPNYISLLPLIPWLLLSLPIVSPISLFPEEEGEWVWPTLRKHEALQRKLDDSLGLGALEPVPAVRLGICSDPESCWF